MRSFCSTHAPWVRSAPVCCPLRTVGCNAGRPCRFVSWYESPCSLCMPFAALNIFRRRRHIAVLKGLWCFLGPCFLGVHQARGASLVERHASDVSKAKKAAGGKDGGKKNFSWSREEDFEQRRSFTPQVKCTFSSSKRLLCLNLEPGCV